MMNLTTNTGTEVKFAVTFTCGDLSMDDMEFTCSFYTTSTAAAVSVAKSEMVRKTSNRYIAVVNTTDMASGTIKMRVDAVVPDEDVADGDRAEVLTLDTGIIIKR